MVSERPYYATARRIRLRSRSLVPPHTPDRSGSAMAYSRQSDRTGQVRQTALASFEEPPFPGKYASVPVERQAPLAIHSGRLTRSARSGRSRPSGSGVMSQAISSGVTRSDGTAGVLAGGGSSHPRGGHSTTSTQCGQFTIVTGSPSLPTQPAATRYPSASRVSTSASSHSRCGPLADRLAANGRRTSRTSEQRCRCSTAALEYTGRRSCWFLWHRSRWRQRQWRRRSRTVDSLKVSGAVRTGVPYGVGAHVPELLANTLGRASVRQQTDHGHRAVVVREGLRTGHEPVGLDVIAT